MTTDADCENPISEQLPATPDIDDYDDVEGHGLREVAIGVSAAAIIGGGASAALASTATSFHPANTAHHAVEQVQSHIGHVPRGVEQAPDAGRPTDLGAGTSHLGAVKDAEHKAAHATQHAAETKAAQVTESAKRIAGFGKQITKGEADVVQHDVEIANTLLRNITKP